MGLYVFDIAVRVKLTNPQQISSGGNNVRYLLTWPETGGLGKKLYNLPWTDPEPTLDEQYAFTVVGFHGRGVGQQSSSLLVGIPMLDRGNGWGAGSGKLGAFIGYKITIRGPGGVVRVERP
jgi:hypothetical protein